MNSRKKSLTCSGGFLSSCFIGSMKRGKIFAYLFLQVLFVSFLNAATLYVASDGSHTSPYDSWATASTNIQSAVTIAYSGDTVFVADGVYMLSEQIEITNAVTIFGVNGPVDAIVDGNNSTRCFYLDHPGAVIDGLTMRNGKTDEGGGVYFREGGTVNNCMIVSNEAPSGGGAFMYYGGLLQNSIVSGNLATTTNVQSAGNFFYGGGVHCYNGGTVQNSTIRNNSATWENCPSNTSYYCYGAGVYSWHAGIIQNCLIENNRSIANNIASGGGVYLHEGSLLRNCVVNANIASAADSANPVGQGGGVYIDLGGDIDSCTIARNITIGEYNNDGAGVFAFRITNSIVNSIIYFNNGKNVTSDGDDIQYSYCCSHPALPGTGNIGVDPLFVDLANKDFRLNPASPCVDTGASSVLFDYDFNERPIDGDGDGTALVDIGAYEYTADHVSAPDGLSASDGLYLDKVSLSWNTVAGVSEYQVWRNTNLNFMTATQLDDTVDENAFDDTNATPGTVYYYWVKTEYSGFSSFDSGYAMSIGLVPAYRFYSAGAPESTYVHLWTINETEKDVIITWPSWQYEGIAWYAMTNMESGSVPLYRLYEPNIRRHIYTVNPLEYVTLTNASWEGEGIQYYVYSTNSVEGAVPAYRFYNAGNQNHHFTIDENEKDTIIATPQWGYTYEGAAFYVFATNTVSAFRQETASSFLEISGDYNGDGTEDLALYEEAAGNWFILENEPGFEISNFQPEADQPVAEKFEIAPAAQWGGPGFKPFAFDYDNDGVDDLAVYHEATGLWYVTGIDGAILLWGEAYVE